MELKEYLKENVKEILRTRSPWIIPRRTLNFGLVPALRDKYTLVGIRRAIEFSREAFLYELKKDDKIYLAIYRCKKDKPFDISLYDKSTLEMCNNEIIDYQELSIHLLKIVTHIDFQNYKTRHKVKMIRLDDEEFLLEKAMKSYEDWLSNECNKYWD